MTTRQGEYVRCEERDVPADVRFHTPRRHQGQIVVVSFGGLGSSEHGHGDPFMRIADRSDGSVEYYRWMAK